MTRVVYAVLIAGLVFILPSLGGGGSVESQDQSLEQRVANLESEMAGFSPMILQGAAGAVQRVYMPTENWAYGATPSLFRQARAEEPDLIVPLTCEFRESSLFDTDTAGRTIVDMQCLRIYYAEGVEPPPFFDLE